MLCMIKANKKKILIKGLFMIASLQLLIIMDIHESNYLKLDRLIIKG